MGIRDYIYSTAHAVNENAIKPANNLCSTSYSYGCAAASKIGNASYSYGYAAASKIGNASYSYGCAAASKISNAIGVDAVEKVSKQLKDEDAQFKMQQFASNFATNAAKLAFREALKILPGGGPIVEIVSRSLPDNKELENHKKEEVKALKSKLQDHEEKIKDLQAAMHKMKKESNSKELLNQVETHDLDDVEFECKTHEAYKNQVAAISVLSTIYVHSDESKQPADQLRGLLMKGFISGHTFDELNKTKIAPSQVHDR